MFGAIDSSKAVTVKVPSAATAWNGKTGTFTGNDTTVNWGNGFRGGGWTGSAFEWGKDTAVNSDISLTIKTE
jgi:agmatine/peptidylarginine deiminase